VFSKYFQTPTIAAQYARQQQKIANRVYANRMGNGDEASGDGWRYRGRGAIQLTGKNNYIGFAHDMGMSLEDAIAYLETPEGAIMSAGWFWNNNKLNAIADKNDVTAMTKAINGGTNGLDDRARLYKLALTVV
jgi:putative chitinase